MSNNDNKKIISFELPLDLYEQIKLAAKKDDRTISSYIRKILSTACEPQSSSF